MLSLIALQRTEFKIRPSKDSTFAEKVGPSFGLYLVINVI
jgi:hypothetical protein